MDAAEILFAKQGVTVRMFLQTALFRIHTAKRQRFDRYVDRCLTVFLDGAQSREASR
jgi:hypothetical protein